MSVADNLFLGRERSRRFCGVDDRAQSEAARLWLERLGLDVDVSLPVEQLPVAVQQSIEIARALSMDARVLVMDEPTSALTVMETRHLFERIEQLKREGRAVLFISHKMEEIYRIADRIAVLRDGRLVGTRPASELGRGELVEWMAGRALTEHVRAAARGEAPRLSRRGPVGRGSRPPGPSPGPRRVVRGEAWRGARPRGAGRLRGERGPGRGLRPPPAGPRSRPGRRPGRPPRPAGGGPAPGARLPHERSQGGGPDAPPLGRRERDAREPAALLARRLAPPAAGGAGRSRPGATSSSCRRRRSARPSSTLSGGNQQKALLARLWLTEPAVLLLDEPTRGVDVTAKARIHRLIDEWTRAGCAVVLTSSELPELLALSDRVLVLHRGEVAPSSRGTRPAPRG